MSQLKVEGKVRIRLYDEKGNLKVDRTSPNLVTTLGKNLVASALAGEAPTLPSYIAIGTDSTAPAVGQTALQGSELDRNSASVTRTSNAVEFEATFGAGEGTGSIEEAGLFNAPSSGTMFSRWLTDTISKGALDSLTITWTLTIN